MVQEKSQEIAGQQPVSNIRVSQNIEPQIAGAMPDKIQDLAIPNNGAEVADVGKDMVTDANKSASNTVSAGIT